MSKYTPDFKYRAVLHYHQVHSQQRTAEHFNKPQSER
ncbi:transposase [Neisseria canis]|uniref:Transposase n=1 Tax=Neisseria canis TaxID=493 RepID=A0A3S5E871_9NEIS|nr:transposase [Neisseria canis]